MSWIEGTGNVFDQLVAIQAPIMGTRAAEPTAVDGMAEFPFWINYPLSGRFVGQGAGWGIGTHTLRSELHVMRGSLPDNEAEIRQYLRPYYTALHNDPTLGGTVTEVQEVRYRFTGWDYTSGEKHVGIEFEVDVKVSEVTT